MHVSQYVLFFGLLQFKKYNETSRRQTTPSQSQPATANCVVYKMSIWIAALKGGCRRLT